MSKRKQRRESGSGWLSDGAQSTSLEDVVIEGYGLDIKPSVRIVARPISIFEIRPSMHQPRRAFPSAVRRRMEVEASEYNPVKLLGWWADAAQAINVVAVLEGRDDMPRPEDPDAITSALLNLVDLAATIRRDGLTNPITVARDEAAYIIETGERRWLAYHLLNMVYPDDNWDAIPARVMDDYDLWRQATENSARDDLNAIGKARQLALLLMDLHGMEHFQPISAFEHEQDFYAQVADGEAYRIPRGKGEMLAGAMGVATTQQLRQLRALLRMPRDVWTAADDENWTENAIDQHLQGGDTVVNTTLKPPLDTKNSLGQRAFTHYSERRLKKLPSTERRYLRQLFSDLIQRLDSVGYED